MDAIEGYKVGERPPELAEDGTFTTPLGIRGKSLIDKEGRILTVNKTTGLLYEDKLEEIDLFADVRKDY